MRARREAPALAEEAHRRASVPARFVLRDNVLMYFNSPKDFTGFRDKPSVRPTPRRLPRGGWPEAARAPSPEAWVALASVLVRSLLPGHAHHCVVPPTPTLGRHPGPHGPAAPLAAPLATPLAAPLAVPRALPLALPVRGMGVRLLMRAGGAARGGERVAPLPISPRPANSPPTRRYLSSQGVVLLEEGNVRTVETGALQKYGVVT